MFCAVKIQGTLGFSTIPFRDIINKDMVYCYCVGVLPSISFTIGFDVSLTTHSSFFFTAWFLILRT